MQIFENLLIQNYFSNKICAAKQCSIKYDHSKFVASQPVNIIITHKYIAKFVLMVAHMQIIFIEFLLMVKIANYINITNNYNNNLMLYNINIIVH